MLTRREFVAKLAVGAALAAMPAKMCAALPRGQTAVVSIHMDQPYLDTTGRALPYDPPVGLRAAAPVAHLTETEFRSHFVYL
ncbi:MAG TPA: hypothetical protein VN885_04415 [Candidatus Acidoferrales bacterium]|nr:hypothetical protein [Candidatus Acidoferrales bacterium]